MIPIALVTGFLGSGKTTFLKRVIERNRDRRLVYLVNEFSPVDVDGQLLDCPPDELVSVPGGSIFCRCLVTQFVQHLRTIAQRARDASPPIEGVVIEASGIADPRVVGDMLEETRLHESYRLNRVITIVDPGTFTKLLRTLPNVSAQVEASSTVLINKTDLHDDATIDETEHAVRRINSDATIVRTSHCDVDVDLCGPVTIGDVHGEYALCADPNYVQGAVRPPGNVSLDRLSSLLGELGNNLYRAKGFVESGGQTVYVDASSSGITTQQVAGRSQPIGLVLIAAAQAGPDLANCIERIRDGEAGAPA